MAAPMLRKMFTGRQISFEQLNRYTEKKKKKFLSRVGIAFYDGRVTGTVGARL